jgi:hypothetical protein
MQANSEPIASKTENQLKDEAISLFRQIVSEITQTPEFKKSKYDALRKGLSSWAGQSMVKRMALGKTIKKFDREIKDTQYTPKTNLDDLKLWENLGRLITLGVRYMALKDQTDPGRIAKLLETPIAKILKNTDFGNIYEMVAASETRALATQHMIQDIFGQFPTKAGILPAIKLKKANTSLKKKNQALKGMEDMPPEMLVSSMISLFSLLIEADEIGLLIQGLSELIRKIHTGSVILGEAGTPLIEAALAEKLRAAATKVDPVIFGKAIAGLLQTFESVSSAVMSCLSENQPLLGSVIGSRAVGENSKIRRKSKKAALVEEFINTSNGTSNGAEWVAKELADLDTQEVGETCNAWLRIINAIHEERPDIAQTLLSSLSSVIDADELKTIAGWIIPDITASIKPIAGAVLPSVINALCDLMTPAPGEDLGELDEALGNLRNILSNNRHNPHGGREI